MTLYVVFKQGVYRHECGGVFGSLAEAEAHARHLAATDKDNYHTYEVVPFELNEQHGPVANPNGSCWFVEPDSVFSVRKVNL